MTRDDTGCDARGLRLAWVCGGSSGQCGSALTMASIGAEWRWWLPRGLEMHELRGERAMGVVLGWAAFSFLTMWRGRRHHGAGGLCYELPTHGYTCGVMVVLQVVSGLLSVKGVAEAARS